MTGKAKPAKVVAFFTRFPLLFFLFFLFSTSCYGAAALVGVGNDAAGQISQLMLRLSSIEEIARLCKSFRVLCLPAIWQISAAVCESEVGNG